MEAGEYVKYSGHIPFKGPNFFNSTELLGNFVKNIESSQLRFLQRGCPPPPVGNPGSQIRLR